MIYVRVLLKNDKHERNDIDIIKIEYEDITIEQLLDNLYIEKVHVGAILVNGIPKKVTYRIEDNSEIYVLPALDGG